MLLDPVLLDSVESVFSWLESAWVEPAELHLDPLDTWLAKVDLVKYSSSFIACCTAFIVLHASFVTCCISFVDCCAFSMVCSNSFSLSWFASWGLDTTGCTRVIGYTFFLCLHRTTMHNTHTMQLITMTTNAITT